MEIYTAFAAITVFLVFAANAFRTLHHLHSVPGPVLAKFTNLQRMLWVQARKAHDVHLSLHRRHGHLVRMGPNMVSVSDPAAIPIIYGFDGRFKKVASIFRCIRPKLTRKGRFV